MNDYLCTGANRCPQNSAECCPQPPVPPCPPSEDGSCPCRNGYVQTLQMLLRTGLSNLVDFRQFAYVTPDFLVGATLTAPVVSATAYDNLAATLSGVFNGFSLCDCDEIDASGPVTLPAVGESTTGVSVSRINLCDLLAVAFTVTGTTETEIEDNYQAARSLLQTLLSGRPRRGEDFPPYPDPCCQNPCQRPDYSVGGVMSLVAGDLLLANTVALGAMDGVLVLANDTQNRFYLVCREDAIVLR